MRYKYFINLLNFVFIFIISSANAEILKDPRTRDETISNTILTSTVTRRADGMYEYTYDIESPVTNKGIIASLEIDLSCNLDFGDVVFSDPKDPYFSTNTSKDGKYVPVQAYGVYAVTTYSGITVANSVYWGMKFKPGQIGKGLKLISPTPPGLRTYTLDPNMQPDGWDYGSYEEEDPTVPWIDEFTVTGSIKAPACTLDTPSEDDRFEGTGRESFGINKLLTYVTPAKDPIIVSSNNETLQFHIFYAENIDKARFKAKLNGKNITHLFKPAPSTNETVTISAKWSRLNKLILSVPGIVNKQVKPKNRDQKLNS